MEFFQQNFKQLNLQVKSMLANEAIFTAMLLILVALASFGLGRQSVLLKQTKIDTSANDGAGQGPAPSLATPEESLPSTYYVASKNSQVYHLPHCSGAKRITEANKIIFNTKEEAEQAGYRPASNCKGI